MTGKQNKNDWFLLPKIRECRAKVDPEKAILSLSLRCVLDV